MGRIASGIGVIPAEEKMKQLVVFDLDGTLAKSKSPIDAKMAALLDKLLGVVKVAVISGANWPQFQKQVLSHLCTDERFGFEHFAPVPIRDPGNLAGYAPNPISW